VESEGNESQMLTSEEKMIRMFNELKEDLKENMKKKQLKNYKENMDKKLEKTQEQLNELREDFNHSQMKLRRL
jgi:hypothetical protein